MDTIGYSVLFIRKRLTNRRALGIINELRVIAPACGSVGTGRRARLRILWQQCRVGSSPIFRIELMSQECCEINVLGSFVA